MNLQLVVPVMLLLLAINTESDRTIKFIPKTDLLKRLIRQSYDKEGRPELYNCAQEKQQSLQVPVPVNFELVITPRWTNYTEFQKDSDVLKKYNWSYKMVRVLEESGKTVEKLIYTDKFKSEDSLIISPYSLPPGYYKIYPNVSRKSHADKLKPFMIRECHLITVGLKPIPLINGGIYRVVPSNTPIVLNGSESLDPNKAPRDNSDLKYQWNCTQRLKQTFCKKDHISTRSVFIVPPKYVVPGDKFDVVLKIATTFDTQAESRQEVEVVQDGVLLEIRCQKNCPPVSEQSTTNIVTFLQVMCLKNCKGVKSDGFIWSMNTTSGDLNLDYEKDTQFGNKGEKFVINSKVLTPGEYRVSVQLNDKKGKGQAMTTLIFDQAPNVTSCFLVPPQGESVHTYFQFQCKQQLSFRRHCYELYAMEKNESISSGQLIVNGFYPEVFNKFFMLPSSEDRTFTIKASIDNGPYTLVPLNAKVTSYLSQKPTKERIQAMTKFYNYSLSKKMSSTDPVEREMALHTFQAFVNELVDVKDQDDEHKKFVADLKYRAANDLLKVLPESPSQIVKLGDTVAKLLTYQDSKKCDPALARAGTTFCRKLGQKYLDMLIKDRFPMTKGEVNSKVASTLSKCFSANSNTDFALIEPFSLNIVTESAILIEPAPVEGYSDYKDFSEKYHTDIENFQEVTANIFEGNRAAAKAIALSTAVGEKSIVQKGVNSEIMVIKDKAKSLSEMTLKSNGITLRPSKDLRGGHLIDIFVMSWTKDILWWNVNNTKPVSNIVNIEFWHSTCKERIQRFNTPANLFFEMNQTKFHPKILQDVINIPNGYSRKIHSELNRHIYVRRVGLPFQRVLLVGFYNLSSVALSVVVTVFKYPTIEDFIPGKTIKANSNFISFINKKKYDVWAYIGILSHKGNVSEGSEVKLSIGVYSTCCILWLPNKYRWVPACLPGTENNLTTIHCKCRNFSTYAGHIQNLESVRLEVFYEKFELYLETNVVIFLTVVSVFVAYCLLLIFTFCRKKQKAILYFLTDNLTKHHYAYLVMVTTGTKGTSSHVTIQLRGVQDSTLAHVLNYPDPKTLLFQRKCKAVFVVTNEKYLGEILGIECWVDFAGANPSWYCQEIIVYDLQLKRSWYFRVKRLFSPLDGNIFVSLTPSEPNDGKVVNTVRKISVRIFSHTWYFWAQEKNLSYITKLTVIFSTVLMILAVVLMVQGVPKMKLKDILDLEKFRFEWFEVTFAISASSVTFVFHIVLTWSFRFSASDAENQNILPSETSKLCWRVLIVLIVSSTTFLIAWGFWVPFYRSLVWLATSCLAIAIEIIIYENIFAIIMSFFYKYEQVKYMGDQFAAVLRTIHQQRRLLMGHFGGSLLGPYMEQYYTPLEKIELKIGHRI